MYHEQTPQSPLAQSQPIEDPAPYLEHILSSGSEKSNPHRTVGERLQPTIDSAIIERDKYARKALFAGYALNVAIAVQILLGALSATLAASLTDGRHARISTEILGGFVTLVAAYMARARGAGEPELCITRVKDLEQFLRECRAFQTDHAHKYGTPENGLDEWVEDLRGKFEESLGNTKGERRLSPVGITPSQAAPRTQDNLAVHDIP